MTLTFDYQETHALRLCIKTRIQRVSDMLQLDLEEEKREAYRTELKGLINLKNRLHHE